jgi:hypothetical protein
MMEKKVRGFPPKIEILISVIEYNFNIIMQVIRANLSVIEIHPVSVLSNHGFFKYQCLNVTGHQVCFSGRIYTNHQDEVKHWVDSANPLGVRLSEYLPITLFYGKKEGDEVTLQFKNWDNEIVNVIVTLNSSQLLQKNFEDALYDRTLSFGGICDPSETHGLSRIKQYCFMVTAHEQYAQSIGRPTLEPHKFKYAFNYIICLKEECQKEPILSPTERVTIKLDQNPDLDIHGRAQLAMDELMNIESER